MLRPYQTAMDAALTAAFRTKRRVLAVAPCGAGKTVMFAHRANAADGRVLILAHRRELIRQARDKAIAHGVPASIYPSAEPARVMVGSVQTLANRIADLPRFRRIIVDEAHHSIARQYAAILASQPEAEVEGWTATPERLDGRGLGEVFDVMVEGPTVATLTAGGFLVPARVFGPPPGGLPDLNGMPSLGGDFQTDALDRVMRKPSLLGSAPDHYEQICPGARTIVFCVSVKHAQESAAAFRAEGWRFVAVWGSDPHRDDKMASFAAGRIQGIVTCELVSEGLDIPDVDCIIMQVAPKRLHFHLDAAVLTRREFQDAARRGGSAVEPVIGDMRRTLPNENRLSEPPHGPPAIPLHIEALEQDNAGPPVSAARVARHPIF